MKKILLFSIILSFSALSFAQEASEEPAGESAVLSEQAVADAHAHPNELLFIDGIAENSEHLEFFLRVFRIEAGGAGYTVTDTKEEAAYTFMFNVAANMAEDDQGVLVPVPEYDNQYIIRISLLDNSNDSEILFFDFFFTDLEEMYEYTQSIFHMATVYIPPDRRDVFFEPDRRWQNKWLYFRASLDYPIAFYALQPTGLRTEQAAYNLGGDGKLSQLQHLDHLILPQPGLTVGVEVQFLSFMGMELVFKVNMGDPKTNFFFNMAAGASIKFSIKTVNFLIQPYIAGLIPINMSPEFEKAPPFSLGAGAQLGVKGGSGGAIFIDLNFMYSFGDVYRKNPYIAYAPFPPLIHYKHFVFGIGVGYKFGIINR